MLLLLLLFLTSIDTFHAWVFIHYLGALCHVFSVFFTEAFPLQWASFDQECDLDLSYNINPFEIFSRHWSGSNRLFPSSFFSQSSMVNFAVDLALLLFNMNRLATIFSIVA